MFTRAALIHYHEIGLKGRNRSLFERRLRDNLSVAVRGITDEPVERIASRLIVVASDPKRVDELVDRIAVVPGVANVSPVLITARDIDQINVAALLAVGEAGEYETFAVEARRSSTEWELNSMDMNRIIGQHLVDNTGKRVNLSRPDVKCRVEVVQGDAYVSARKVSGPGGLPVGSAGKVISLLSAGIDSPVATWRLARRGAIVVGVHFSGRPQTNDLSERLVHQLARQLEHSGGIGRIYYVPFGDLQKEISLAAPPDLRVLLYRRLMIRVAEAIAAFENAKALVTGESLGQVASQTLENIQAVDEAATLPILRPLIGSDKLEIIAEARKLGTLELSTQDHADCCTLFMPRSPETHASIAQVVKGEVDLDLERMVSDALKGTTYRDYECPAYRSPKRIPATMLEADAWR